MFLGRSSTEEKNTPGNDLPLDLGEPNLDLVQPRRIGGGKVNVDLGDNAPGTRRRASRFVSREIVGDGVDLASGRLGSPDWGQKVHKLCAGMAWRGLAKDFSAVGLQGRVERKGAVAVQSEDAPGISFQRS
jgi:hypothetical protein